MIQGWGMTETSPVCAMAFPPEGRRKQEMDWRAKTGRVVAGVEIRVVADDGSILPADGHSVGEFEVRGPWVTGSYYGDPSPDRFHDGWLRTGDVGTSTAGASCRSRTGPRTSSSPGASGSRRSSSRTR
jgi:fatty-acyl-CoA synthase